MINKLYSIESNSTIPYDNLALEAYLLDKVGEGECILYLWQNKQTVVIGRNQNAWKECDTQRLEEDGGHLIRRLSGGGAVFHDLGNLNFTFLVPKADYDVEKQMEVILQAVQSLGITAEKSGRNDITAEGRKFSGNAFYQKGSNCYHHGTIMFKVDAAKMQTYLNVSREKLRSNGVESVRSRVVNLVEFKPELTIEALKSSLMKAFGEVYKGEVLPYKREGLELEALEEYRELFSSWDWIYGKKILFTDEHKEKFPWGEVALQLEVASGRIKEALCYSDSLNTHMVQKISQSLIGCMYDKEVMKASILSIPASSLEEEIMRQDMAALIR